MENFSINSELTDAQLISVAESQGRFVYTETHPKRIEFLDTKLDDAFFITKNLWLSELIRILIDQELKDARHSGEQDAKREIRKALGFEK